MKRFGILAHPVKQSLSPYMQSAGFKAANIDATFEAFDVPPETLADFLCAHADHDGFAVSVPHKEAMLKLLDGAEEEAKAIGAVNTIYKKEGKWWGDNTDAPGIVRALTEVIPEAELKTKRALILGAGGAARAAVYVLKPRVNSVTIINRTVPRGVAIAKEFGVRYGGKIEDLFTETPDFIVNATSVGMNGEETEIVPFDFLKPTTVVFDLVYRPGEKTHLVREAEARGCRVVDGKTLLLYQGVLQFERWTGQTAPEDAMRTALA